MTVTLLPSQSSTSTSTEAPIPYTGNPWLLCWSDILLFFRCAWSIPGILYPWNNWANGELDELYPYSPANLFCLLCQGILIIIEAIFLLSLPFLIFLPIWTAMIYVAAVLALIWAICLVLNGTEDSLESTVDLGDDAAKHRDQCWIYLNGVATGKHWLQTNLNRLSLTFLRPITGVHNRTAGIIFDLLQCIIERNFCYATNDIRRSYALIKDSLCNEEYKKVVLILHSQGGIEGGLILDWLLSELPHDTINKLEIYTFGSAANHFNNPPRHAHSTALAYASGNTHAVRHIEHYADDGEFVARWGVLNFARVQNRYMGRVFIRSGTGHLLNQHYLNSMFPLDKDKRVLKHNDFMDMEVNFTSDGAEDRAREGYLETLLNGGNGSNGAVVEDRQNGVTNDIMARLAGRKPRVKDFSRLWCYRNGGSPSD